MCAPVFSTLFAILVHCRCKSQTAHQLLHRTGLDCGGILLVIYKQSNNNYSSLIRLSADFSLRLPAMASFTSVRAFLSSFIRSRGASIVSLLSSGNMRKLPARDFRTTCSPDFAIFRYLVWLVRKSLVLTTTILFCCLITVLQSYVISFYLATFYGILVTKNMFSGHQRRFSLLQNPK